MHSSCIAHVWSDKLVRLVNNEVLTQGDSKLAIEFLWLLDDELLGPSCSIRLLTSGGEG